MKSSDTVGERLSKRDGADQIAERKFFTRRNLARFIRNPTKAPKYVGKAVNAKYYDYTNTSSFNDSGVDIFREDWDNLIVLDACRFDYFKKYSDLPGKLTKKESKASMTHEWLTANFTDRRLHDLVYVSANGNFLHQRKAMNSAVHEFIGLWDDEYRTGEMNRVTPPGIVTKHAVDAAENYSRKRLLVHYLQPHYPYIGPGAEGITPEGSLEQMVVENRLTTEKLRELYRENLEIVIEEVHDLLSHLEGKTVVTSDHGEMLGERSYPMPIRQYSHPRGIYTNELVEIPWLTYTRGQRRRIVEDEPETVEYDDEGVEEHLRQLGYAL